MALNFMHVPFSCRNRLLAYYLHDVLFLPHEWSLRKVCQPKYSQTLKKLALYTKYKGTLAVGYIQMFNNREYSATDRPFTMMISARNDVFLISSFYSFMVVCKNNEP